MNRLIAPLLALALGLAPAAGWANAPMPLEAARAMAGAAPGELVARLKAAHKRTDRALKLRSDRFDAWQSAVLERDEAAGRVERMKRDGERGARLDTALREALVLDERTNIARSQLMAAEAQVAKTGAKLLRLYDAILTLKRREIEDARTDAERTRVLRTYAALKKQRSKVHRSLGPVLRAGREITPGVDESIAAQSDDDIETLLEKADLARDLEERFLRRAQAVERRIHEAMEERAVARDVAGLVQSQRLFDEDDMRLFVVGGDVRATQQMSAALPGGGASEQSAPGALAGSPVADTAAPPPANERSAEQESVGGGNADGFDGAPDPTAGAGEPPAPPQDAPAGMESDQDVSVDDGAVSQPPPEAPSQSPLPDVGGIALPRSAERAFSAGSADMELESLLASGELSLPQLRALQKKLKARAKAMRAQEAELKKEVKDRARR